MKKKILIFTIFLLSILIVRLFLYQVFMPPVKYAITKNNIIADKQYIIVKIQKSTISQWTAIEKEKEIYEKPIDVKLTGNKPSFDYDLESGNNSFICYGKYEGENDLHGEKYKIFNVTSWDILYPISRNTPLNFLLPKSYLCKYDLN